MKSYIYRTMGRTEDYHVKQNKADSVMQGFFFLLYYEPTEQKVIKRGDLLKDSKGRSREGRGEACES